MSSDMELLATKRAERAGHSGAWEPADALREALRLVESGEWDLEKIIIMGVDQDGGLKSVRAKTTHEGTVAMLELAKVDAIQEWQRGR